MIGGGALWYIVAEIDRNLAVRKMKNAALYELVTRYGSEKLEAFIRDIKLLKNDSEKVARAYEVFGRSGADILRVIEKT